MRLLKTEGFDHDSSPTRLELGELQAPPERYAILSHTWFPLREEVVFADLERMSDVRIWQLEGRISVDLTVEPGASLKTKKGWFKIMKSLMQAREEGYEWFWADTCCIDKSSSAELSEAINSMYSWYQLSSTCYVYLDDVSSPQTIATRSICRWMTRGWTLQELIASRQCCFYSRGWHFAGDKISLRIWLTLCTGIDSDILSGHAKPSSTSVATRMSWAVGRTTTRVEDRAYSLMGLFDVNMPLLYGEGRKAFLRLQQHIIQASNDQTIFAWESQDASDEFTGFFAESPDSFASSSHYHSITDQDQTFAVTNRGLEIQLPLIPCSEPGLYMACLQVSPHPSSSRTTNAVFITKLSKGVHQYARVRPGEVASVRDAEVHPPTLLLIRQTPPSAVPASILHVNAAHFVPSLGYKTLEVTKHPAEVSFYLPPTTGEIVAPHEQQQLTFPSGNHEPADRVAIEGGILLRREDGDDLALLLGYMLDGQPGALLLSDLQYYLVGGHDPLARLEKLSSMSLPLRPLGTLLVHRDHALVVNIHSVFRRAKTGVCMVDLDFRKPLPGEHHEEVLLQEHFADTELIHRPGGTVRRAKSSKQERELSADVKRGSQKSIRLRTDRAQARKSLPGHVRLDGPDAETEDPSPLLSRPLWDNLIPRAADRSGNLSPPPPAPPLPLHPPHPPPTS